MRYKNIKASINAICLKQTPIYFLTIGSKVKVIKNYNHYYGTCIVGDIGKISYILPHTIDIYINGKMIRIIKSFASEYMVPA